MLALSVYTLFIIIQPKIFYKKFSGQAIYSIYSESVCHVCVLLCIVFQTHISQFSFYNYNFFHIL